MRYCIRENERKLRRALPNIFQQESKSARATYMTKHLTQPEIDFLQGRVSANVFMRNYFNPVLISDLKEQIFRAIEEIMRTELLGKSL